LSCLALETQNPAEGSEIVSGLLHCREATHWFPIVRGIPRMLPDAIQEHWSTIKDLIRQPLPEGLASLITTLQSQGDINYHRATRENFSHEWNHHDLGDRTWGIRLSDRVQWFFLNSLNIPKEELVGKLMLDAGCGNGSQSVAYSALGLEVIALDLSSGVEKGYGYRHLHSGAQPERVHFVQGNLQQPPLAPNVVDIIHSAGVLHHTPDTLTTFRALRPLLKSGGTFYVWLYRYEKFVTPVVNSIRAVSTKIPPSSFAQIARLLAVPFMIFCQTLDVLGIRKYSSMNRREAALALMDIFGAPYAYYHSYDEVRGWYQAAGFGEIWYCNEGRRGFGVCGRDGSAEVTSVLPDLVQPQSTQVAPPTVKVQLMHGESA
jgi:2-polyprenyl-3-methyl-5-hydroxy-6-metoxy-1,4-benzoquinol methylase